MSERSAARPAGVQVVGWLIVAMAAATMAISVIWVVASGPISAAGDDLAAEPDSLGLLAVPFQYALPFGLVTFVSAAVLLAVAKAFLEGSRSGLVAVRVLVVLVAFGVLVWNVALFSWMSSVPVDDPGAPPPGVLAAIVGFVALFELAALAVGLWALFRPRVVEYFQE